VWGFVTSWTHELRESVSQGALSFRFLTAKSWNSLTVCVFTVHTRHNLINKQIYCKIALFLFLTVFFIYG